ncbi:unnamed protein product [Notodromas monacha]|uniref:Elongation of very long chain fatty acids protein n=1 Tax=Notodromas monacha TaxID=399045 RepID=A0A7R9BE27_9CRUS|nr:unnamed protein product [Notodromas monacha]CAG0913620.1 unnamed protein product [Notodromas monacha]
MISARNITADFSQSDIYWFERNFDSYAGRRFLESNWPLAFGTIALYISFVFAGPAYMKRRERFEVRIPLILWNVLLASFSIFGTFRTAPHFFRSLSTRGLHCIVCDNGFFQQPVVGFWCYMFTLSKLVELGDTVFIVLRKQPLIFLHWYHHITVLLFCWHGNSEFSSTGQFFGFMNFTVHSLMYTYYALKAARIKLPTVIAFFITSFQLSQMVVGIIGNCLAFSFKNAGLPCNISNLSLKLAFIMYFSYFVLFVNFFYRTYFKRGAKRSVVAKTEQVICQAQILAKKAM